MVMMNSSKLSKKKSSLSRMDPKRGKILQRPSSVRLPIRYTASVPNLPHVRFSLLLPSTGPELRRLPLEAIGEFINPAGQTWRDMMDHDTLDDFWQALRFDDRYQEIDVPCLHVTGWYDLEDLPGAFHHYEAMAAHSPVYLPQPGAMPEPTGADKTSFVVYIGEDHAGALLEILTEGGIGTMVTEGDHQTRAAAGAAQ